jgi:hypothetical protein
MTRNVSVVEVQLLDPNGDLAPFTLRFYGISIREFYVGGADPILTSLKRLGLQGKGYKTTPLMFSEVYFPEVWPKFKRRVTYVEPPPAPPPLPAPDLSYRRTSSGRRWKSGDA